MWQRLRRDTVPPGQKYSKEAVIALTIHWCFMFGNSMSGVFLVLYLWRLTGDLTMSAVYNVTTYVMTIVIFAYGGWLAKRKDRLFTCRLGIFLISLFYLAVVLAGEEIVRWYVLFAMVQGLAGSFYWVSYITLQYDVSTDENRARFLAINFNVTTSASLMGPALAGFLISRFQGLHGYVLVFGLAFVMYLVAFLISFRMKLDSSHHRTYYLRLMGQVMRREPKFTRALISWFVFGLLQGVMLFLPNILLYTVVPKENVIGYLGVGFSLLSILVSSVLARVGGGELQLRYLVLSLAGLSAGALLLNWDMTLVTVLIFITLHAVNNPVQNNLVGTHYYQLIGKLPLKGVIRIETVVIREAFLNVGRICSIGIMLLLTSDVQGIGMALTLLFIALLQFVQVWFLNMDQRADQDRLKQPTMSA
ncbi:MFS transporter [Paenibacillus sp. y28]|uniref:MFS transporter n=1 Tax=Paenibacillus sp. y28 TaxID=3129110 RepID=UPI00301949C0